MERNGHELEMKYVSQINQVLMSEARPNVFDFIWVNKYRKSLRKRLEQLTEDFDNGIIEENAYSIWENMIKEAL